MFRHFSQLKYFDEMSNRSIYFMIFTRIEKKNLFLDCSDELEYAGQKKMFFVKFFFVYA